MKKIREEIILSKLRQLEDSLHFIVEFLPSDHKLLENRKDRNALYKETEFAIQTVIDICSVINSDVGTETPSDEESIIYLADKNGVLSSNLSKKILSMKGFRNVLVHRYDSIDNKKAFESIKSGLNDFELFIVEINRFLDKQKQKIKKVL